MKGMTLNLAEREDEALEAMAKKKAMTKTAVIRQALRLYQLLDAKMAEGKEMVFRDLKTKELEQIVLIGCGFPGMD